MLFSREELRLDVYIPYPYNLRNDHIENVTFGVKMEHIPTGIVVKSDKFKSQIKNKAECEKLLDEELKKNGYVHP